MASKGYGKGKRSLYPGSARKAKPAISNNPISGVYKGSLSSVELELKLDVDKIRTHTSVLNMISGSAVNKEKAKVYPWLKGNRGVFFRSNEAPRVKKIPQAANSDTLVTSRVEITWSDGRKSSGRFELLLRLPQDDGVWGGDVKLVFENASGKDGETVTFEGVMRDSPFFVEIALDVDYVDKVIFPTIAANDFSDSPKQVKDRKFDVFQAFEDAGVKVHYDEKLSNKIVDPTPDNPWTKDDMYDVMMAHFQKSDRDVNVWCMIATKPPDPRYMGYSFSKDGNRGFGMFTGHKSFKGLMNPDDKVEHANASRKFLHYFVHEIGHTLGLVHPFENGKPHALTWMNYAWKYDAKYGAGEFYDNFCYSFTEEELKAIRHSPSKAFRKEAASSGYGSGYSQVKSQPSSDKSDLDDDDDEDDSYDEAGRKLNFTIKIRPDPYAVGELVQLEARLKNVGEIATSIDANLQPEGGNVTIYITPPDGNVKISDSFYHYTDSSPMHQKLILNPPGEEEGSDRYSELIQFGETTSGPLFNAPGEYVITAVYNGSGSAVVSNTLKTTIQKGDYEADSDANVAALLGGSNKKRFDKAKKRWVDIAKEEVTKKKNKVQTLLSMFSGLLRGDTREADDSSDGKSVSKTPSAIKQDDVLKGTDNLVTYYHEQGGKSDNMNYRKVVFSRGKILKEMGENERASNEFNQLIADMVQRGVKYSVIKGASDEWNSLYSPKDTVDSAPVDTYSADSLQKRVDKIVDWYPAKEMTGKPDASGIGLGKGFSNFDHDQLEKAMKIVRMIFNKYAETSDLNDVLDYADSLQKGYQVNHLVLQWAVEVFIVHSTAAKKAGIMYPLPPDMDKSLMSSAAIFQTQRTGTPQEDWMNYWRCDADLNYHHRHWHIVYVVGGLIGQQGWLGDWIRTRGELLRQGELFGAMHAQMLARYNAERESWGLSPARAWSYNEFDPIGFNAGFEFHNARQNATMSPRGPTSFPPNAVSAFQRNESAYQSAIISGFLPDPPTPVVDDEGNTLSQSIEMDPNWAGHVIEASSRTWSRYFGSIHNSGHGVIGSNSSTGSSYMSSTVTAMRDPIFYRWHKRIDDLWQSYAEGQITELASDQPPVQLRPNDILITTERDPPPGFANNWDEGYPRGVIRTYLGPAQKRFEWDNKISHDPFYYHIRYRRTDPSVTGELNLTFRIFICPTRRITERKRWIEMDKFVYSLPAGQDSAVLSRPDIHSSVIKRIPSQMRGDIEAPFTRIQAGHCECGWAYNMLLPRGVASGEEYSLCVFVSDNNIDGIDIRSSCGSLSFCGASGAQYPDRRAMGYPFCFDLAFNGNEVPIPEALGIIPNAAISTFVILNDAVVESVPGLTDLWSPWTQMRLNDGTLDTSNPESLVSFRSSRITGRLRVLIDDQFMTSSVPTFQRLRVRFQGRGAGNGAYEITAATLARRADNSLNITGRSYQVTLNGQTTFSVPEFGIVSDEIPLSSSPVDLFVTFMLNSPGCFLRGRQGLGTSLWIWLNPQGDQLTAQNWQGMQGLRTSRSLYCIGGIEVPIPEEN